MRDRKGRSTSGREYQPGCKEVSFDQLCSCGKPYQKGLSTALHGGLQAIGSHCRIGVSGFSFNGV